VTSLRTTNLVVEPAEERALAAMRDGPGPRRVARDVIRGRADLRQLAKTVAFWHCGSSAGWRSWLLPVCGALDIFVCETEQGDD
jgi:hypothetical protein